MRKEQLEREHVERERSFVERLNESHETAMKRLADSHRERIALLDRQFLQQKQQLMRAREVFFHSFMQNLILFFVWKGS